MAEGKNIKKCSKCKEEIAEDAKKCKHCGADQRNWFIRHKILTGIIGLFVLGIVISAVGSGSQTEQNNKETVKKTDQKSKEIKEEIKTPEKVDTTAFIAEFDKNQLQAEEKYKNKFIEFTGIISNISEDIGGTAFLSIKPTADQYYFGTTIKCSFKSKSEVTSLANGQTVVLQGTVKDQSLGIIQINDCKVVK